MHRTYTPDGGDVDVNVAVPDGDVFVIPRGYHGPCVAAPGYPLYYLNVLAGPGGERSMAFCDDPAHHWVRDTWDGMATDPRVPMTGAAAMTRLTTAEAIVRYLVAQRTVIDGIEAPLVPGVFAIFGHGNVTCLGPALYDARDELPTWRGQNEQGMALAAVGFAKAMRRRQFMVATTSIGPGCAQHGHRRRRGDGQPPAGAAARRRHVPEPAARPRAAAGRALRQPVDDGQRRVPAGRAVLGPDHPARAGDPVAAAGDRRRCSTRRTAARRSSPCPRTCRPRRTTSPTSSSSRRRARPSPGRGPTPARSPRPSRVLRAAPKPLIVAGGGVHYSLAEAELAAFAERHGIPVVETVAGKSTLTADHPSYAGPIGVVGSEGANRLAAEADVVVAVGHPPRRLRHRVVERVPEPGDAARRASTPPASTPASTGRSRSSATPARRSSSSTPRSATGGAGGVDGADRAGGGHAVGVPRRRSARRRPTCRPTPRS